MPATTSSSMVSPVGSNDQTDATTTLTLKERQSRSVPREDSKDGDGDAPLPGDRFSWLKDFDSSLWSSYFTTPENSHYSDC